MLVKPPAMALETRSIADPREVVETIPGAMRSATDVEVFDNRAEATRCRALENAGPAVDDDKNTVLLRMHNAGFGNGQFLTVDRATLEALIETDALR